MPYRIVLDRLRVGVIFCSSFLDGLYIFIFASYKNALAVTEEETSVAIARINVGRISGPEGLSTVLLKAR